MKKQFKEINIGSLLKEIDESTETDVVNSLKTKKIKYDYSFVFVDGPDFAIRKKGTKLSKVLISIFNKDLLYILDENTNKIEKVLSEKSFKSFFSDLSADDIIIPAGVLSYSKKVIEKEDVDKWFSLLSFGKGIKLFVLAGIIDFYAININPSSKNIIENINKRYQENKSLMKYIIKTREHPYDYKNLDFLNTLINTAYAIFNCYDLDTAKYFVDKELISNGMPFNVESFFIEAMGYKLNGRRAIDYVLFDLYKQGYKGNIHTYLDYLNMSKKYYGYVKEKYPQALLSEHNILAAKIREKNGISEKSTDFENVMNETENFSYTPSINKFAIIMPKTANDMVDEGQRLNHCVSSYIDKVINKDCVVVFMREKKSLEESYLTIEILPDRSVRQIEGKNKRCELTKEEQEFILKWAKVKHLKITAQNVEIKK